MTCRVRRGRGIYRRDHRSTTGTVECTDRAGGGHTAAIAREHRALHSAIGPPRSCVPAKTTFGHTDDPLSETRKLT
eukprot:8761675-Pyramimonas_sp.AAC.2